MILSILGAATATKRGAHLGLSVFTDLLPKTAQSVLALICDLLSAAFCAASIQQKGAISSYPTRLTE